MKRSVKGLDERPGWVTGCDRQALLFRFIIYMYFFFCKMRDQDPIITVKTLVTEAVTIDDTATAADRDDDKHYNSGLSQPEPHIDRCAELSNPQLPSGNMVSLAAKIEASYRQHIS